MLFKEFYVIVSPRVLFVYNVNAKKQFMECRSFPTKGKLFESLKMICSILYLSNTNPLIQTMSTNHILDYLTNPLAD